MFERLKLFWQLWTLKEEVDTMDTRLLVQLAIAALTSGISAVGVSYSTGTADWKALAGAFFGAAFSGAIHYVRQPATT